MCINYVYVKIEIEKMNGCDRKKMVSQTVPVFVFVFLMAPVAAGRMCL